VAVVAAAERNEIFSALDIGICGLSRGAAASKRKSDERD
jgi:hypothetical protein